VKPHPPERVAQYTAAGWWSEDTVDGLFSRWVAARPDAPACADQWGTRRTWAELDASVDS
jgi:acyl-CoA synthetase